MIRSLFWRDRLAGSEVKFHFILFRGINKRGLFKEIAGVLGHLNFYFAMFMREERKNDDFDTSFYASSLINGLE